MTQIYDEDGTVSPGARGTQVSLFFLPAQTFENLNISNAKYFKYL